MKFKWKYKTFLQENPFGYDICKILVILFRPQCDNIHDSGTMKSLAYGLTPTWICFYHHGFKKKTTDKGLCTKPFYFHLRCTGYVTVLSPYLLSVLGIGIFTGVIDLIDHWSDEGLLPVRHQDITWTSADLLSIRGVGTELIQSMHVSFKKSHLKKFSSKHCNSDSLFQLQGFNPSACSLHGICQIQSEAQQHCYGMLTGTIWSESESHHLSGLIILAE